jgi:hypothetical protein
MIIKICDDLRMFSLSDGVQSLKKYNLLELFGVRQTIS